MSKQQILQFLRNAIELDKNCFVKAKIDTNLAPIRSQVDRLLAEMQQEAKTKAGQEISKAELMAERMEGWFKSDFSDENARVEYSFACNKIQEAKRKYYKGQSYFDYSEAFEIMDSVKRFLVYARKAIRDDLDYSKRRLGECNADVERVRVKIRKEECLFYGILISGIVIWLIGLASGLSEGAFEDVFLLFILPEIPVFGIFVALVNFVMVTLVGASSSLFPVIPGILSAFGAHIVYCGLFVFSPETEEPRQMVKEIKSLKQRITVDERCIHD